MSSTSEDEDDAEGSWRRCLLLFMLLAVNSSRSAKASFFKSLLDAEDRRRRERIIPRVPLLEPSKSAWKKLYESGNDSALITITGFDHSAFKVCLDLYKPYFDGHDLWTGEMMAGIIKNC
jgi:hypothetical protein